MKNITTYLLTATIGLAALGCKKDKQEPAPVGGITGLFTPANVLVGVTATLVSTTTTASTPVAGTVNPTGSYSFANLPVGSYTVTYTAATGYVSPAAQTATVTANTTVTLPAITIEQVVPDKTAALTAKTWKLTDLTTSGVSVYAVIVPACNQDDLIKFNANKTVVYDANTTKCAPTDPQTQNGTWEFLANETRMRITPPTGPTIEGDIVTLTASTLKLNGNANLMGTSVPAEATFTAQ